MTGRSRPWAALLLATGCALWALNAVGGGTVLAADPDGTTMTFETAWLRHTPFADYLLPGLLLGGLGLLSGGAAVVVVRDLRRGATPAPWHRGFVLAVVVLQVLWILGEVVLLWDVVPGMDATTRSFFHGFWWGVGAVTLVDVATALSPGVRRVLSPGRPPG